MIEKEVLKRIKVFIQSQRIKTSELSRIIGINQTSVYGYLDGTNKAPMSFIVLFLESFPEVSAEWLLRGEGEMMKPTRQSHYLEMAARVNGTYMASEDESPATWQQAFTLLNEKINLLSNQIQKA